MKLIIQIPCFNEAETLGVALRALPRSVPGFDCVEWLVIDDGSSDATVETARTHGVDHIVRHTQNRGLAEAFTTGLKTCLSLGADVIVNTDADNQYCADDIPRLTAPILEGKAEMVVGARPIGEMAHFSPMKKFLQRLGSHVVRLVSKTDIPDAPSGFRSISRGAAARLMVYNKYTYTLETIIQAGQCGIPVASVPVRVNRDLRPSRLVKSIPSYIRRSIFTIFHIFVLYRAFSFFMGIGAVFSLAGVLLGLRFLFYWMNGQGDGHIQSLILASILIIAGGGSALLAIVSSVISFNRRLLEDVRSRLAMMSGGEPIPHLWSRSRHNTTQSVQADAHSAHNRNS